MHLDSVSFQEPVNTKEVPDYLKIVSHPIDLSIIQKFMRRGQQLKVGSTPMTTRHREKRSHYSTASPQ